FMLWQLKVICHLSYEIKGLDRLPSGKFMCASKHQSSWETVGLMSILSDPAFVVKRETRWVPVFGIVMMRLHHIWIDRIAGVKALEAMAADAKHHLDRGRPIVIFPEGTRTTVHGESPFKLGVYFLYRRLNVACVPIAVNSGLYWRRRSWLKYPGKITLEILEPIAPGLKQQQFMSLLEDTINTATKRLVEDGEANQSSGH
ncbi:MAG: lysophospholipid acyltransferase family protein, partial [Pseudomonadota bacterium]